MNSFLSYFLFFSFLNYGISVLIRNYYLPVTNVVN